MIRLISLVLAVLFLSACNTVENTQPPKYVYLEKTVDLEPTVCLKSEDTAIKRATRLITYNAKTQCRIHGYGWTLDSKLKDQLLSCNACSDDLVSCQAKNVELKCRRLRPGSVGMGMIPWQG
ncbi:MAG: hypothetical protein V3V22_03415 [Methylococcales bacterium]